MTGVPVCVNTTSRVTRYKLKTRKRHLLDRYPNLQYCYSNEIVLFAFAGTSFNSYKPLFLRACVALAKRRYLLNG